MTELEKEKEKSRLRKQVPLIWTFIGCALSCLLLTFTSIAYVSYYVHKNNQQWCELIVFYDDFYSKNPPSPKSPTYEIQKKNAELMHKRRVNLDCK